MKYVTTLALLSLILCFDTVVSQAQITIKRSDYEASKGKRYNYSSYELDLLGPGKSQVAAINTIIAQKGENKQFDFRNITFPTQPSYTGTIRYLNTGDAHPFSNENLAKPANYIGVSTSTLFPDTTVWSYMLLEDTSLKVLAAGFTTGNNQSILFGPLSPVAPPTEPLPVKYGNEWEAILNEVDAPPTKLTSKAYYTVDAWGTLLLPGGRSAPALREKTDIEVIISVNGQVIPNLGTPRSTVGYTFTTLSNMTADIELELSESDGKYAPSLVSYMVQTQQTNTALNPEPKQIPEGFTLAQNFPNPFNPSTTISYNIPFNTDVTFRVSELNGRTVSRVTFPQMKAGNHQFTFSAVEMSSGIYIYTIEAGGYSISKKFTLIK